MKIYEQFITAIKQLFMGQRKKTILRKKQICKCTRILPTFGANLQKFETDFPQFEFFSRDTYT